MDYLALLIIITSGGHAMSTETIRAHQGEAMKTCQRMADDVNDQPKKLTFAFCVRKF